MDEGVMDQPRDAAQAASPPGLIDTKAVSQARDHFTHIRQQYLGGGAQSQQLQRALEQSVKALGLRLNTSATHFVLEFCQNADDNAYSNTVRPTLSIASKPGYCRLRSNEVGFNFENVRAICSVGETTKTDRASGYIGEKGLGFKSVFKIATDVWIKANAYAFKFERDAKLGMIAPLLSDFPTSIFVEDQESLGSTQFLLKLEQRGNDALERQLHAELRAMHKDQNALLLFLRRLRTIDIHIDKVTGSPDGVFHNTVCREDWTAYGGEMIRIANAWTTKNSRYAGAEHPDDYLVVRHITTHVPDEDTRVGIESSEVVLAFPFTGDRPSFYPQKAYAYLPIRESGFKFLLHADFVLSTSRENVEDPASFIKRPATAETTGTHPRLIKHQWNWHLLNALADCFVKAVHRFNGPAAEKLKYKWLGFLRDAPSEVSGNPFSLLTPLILDRIKGESVLETQTIDKSFVVPSQAIFIPQEFRGEDGNFVLADVTRLHDKYYLATGYDLQEPKKDNLGVLKMMGVQVMDASYFLQLVKDLMLNRFADYVNQSLDWHSGMASVLDKHASDADLKMLPIIELRDKRWILPLDDKVYFTDQGSDVVDVPVGINDLLVVDEVAQNDPHRKRLLARVGVKLLSKQEVCCLMLKCHESEQSPLVSGEDLLLHAQYLFKVSNLDIGLTQKPKQFWVHNANNEPCMASKVYADVGEFSISSLLSSEMRGSKMLHPRYSAIVAKKKERVEWMKWLEHTFGIASVMRVSDDGGRFTAEFNHVHHHSPTNTMLAVLIGSRRHHGSRFSTTIESRVRAIPVDCEGGRREPLRCTCLPVQELQEAAPPDMPFLTLEKPEASKWKLLHEFGVVIKPNLAFWLRCLEHVHGTKITIGQAALLYQKIFTTWLEDPEQVKTIFAKNSAILSPASHTWVHKTVCVWKSAPGATGVHQLSCREYSALQPFFVHNLGVKSDSIDSVIKELVAMAHTGQDDAPRRKYLLFSLSEYLRGRPRDCEKLNALKNKPIMPIMSGSESLGPNLRYLNKCTWYFADRHDYHSVFKNVRPPVAFAAFLVKEYHGLAPLASAIVQIWPECEHRLSHLIGEHNEIGTMCHRSIGDTEWLRAKVKYFRSIIRAQHGRLGTGTPERKLDLLHNLHVFSAPNMVSVPSLNRGQLGAPVVRKAMSSHVHMKEIVSETTAELHVFLRKTSGRISDVPFLQLSEDMCTFCEITDETLKGIVINILYADSASAAEDILTRRRINQSHDWNYQAAPLALVEINKKLPSNEEITSSKFSTSEEATANIAASSNPTDGNSNLAKDDMSHHNVLSDIINTVDQKASVPVDKTVVKSKDPFEPLAKFANSKPKTILIQGQGFSNAPPNSESPRQPQAGTRINKENATTTGSAARQSALANRKTTSPHSPTKLDQRPLTSTGQSPRTTPFLASVRDAFFKSPEDKAREEESGIQGELRVFRTLQQIMGDRIDENCWTSELRSQAGDEFTEWQPKNHSDVICDFTVHDAEGTLSTWLVRERFMQSELPVATTYHIEVKSTTAGYDEPFHMSALQMEKCQKPSEAGGRKDVFVIFRVYDLSRGGRLMVYMDAWKEIVAGKLGREADGWVVWDKMT